MFLPAPTRSLLRISDFPCLPFKFLKTPLTHLLLTVADELPAVSSLETRQQLSKGGTCSQPAKLQLTSSQHFRLVPGPPPADTGDTAHHEGSPDVPRAGACRQRVNSRRCRSGGAAARGPFTGPRRNSPCASLRPGPPGPEGTDGLNVSCHFERNVDGGPRDTPWTAANRARTRRRHPRAAGSGSGALLGASARRLETKGGSLGTPRGGSRPEGRLGGGPRWRPISVPSGTTHAPARAPRAGRRRGHRDHRVLRSRHSECSANRPASGCGSGRGARGLSPATRVYEGPRSGPLDAQACRSARRVDRPGEGGRRSASSACGLAGLRCRAARQPGPSRG